MRPGRRCGCARRWRLSQKAGLRWKGCDCAISELVALTSACLPCLLIAGPARLFT